MAPTVAFYAITIGSESSEWNNHNKDDKFIRGRHKKERKGSLARRTKPNWIKIMPGFSI
jgi:hypothetical protein